MWKSVCGVLPDCVSLTKFEKGKLILSLNSGDTELMEPVLKFVTECFNKRAETVLS